MPNERQLKRAIVELVDDLNAMIGEAAREGVLVELDVLDGPSVGSYRSGKLLATVNLISDVEAGEA